MTGDDLKALLPKLDRFHARFHRFFCRSEGRARSRQYLIGLNLPIERKNVENIAEQVGATPRKLQEFVSESPWDDEGCIGELQKFVGEELGAAHGVLILDDTGFAKKGVWSAGVARQYSGTMGRVDNCQIGVFLSYASQNGHTLIDRRLYVHESWFQGGAEARRKRAGLPDDLVFKTKLELGQEMLKAAADRRCLPWMWMTADAAYGDSHQLRQAVESLNKWYCFEVSSSAEVWADDPGWQVPPQLAGGGRPRTRPQPTPSSPASQTVAQLTAALPASAWVRHRVTRGTKGPREYEFALVRVVEKRHRQPGPAAWMMARRPVGSRDPKEFKYYLSNAPETITLPQLAWVGCLRWTIEEDFELAKGELGLDHYELTKHRGWHHHVTLVLLALAFLKSTQSHWWQRRDQGQHSGDPPASGGGAASLSVDSDDRDRLVPTAATPQGCCSSLPHGSLVA